MDVRTRLQSNRVDIELCRQAIQAKRIRLVMQAESETDRRIRELEASNAMLKAILVDAPAVVTHRVLVRTRHGVMDVVAG